MTPAEAKPFPFEVRSLEAGDRAAAIELMRLTLGDRAISRKTEDYWVWKHERNPFGASYGVGLTGVPFERHHEPVVAVVGGSDLLQEAGLDAAAAADELLPHLRPGRERPEVHRRAVDRRAGGELDPPPLRRRRCVCCST